MLKTKRNEKGKGRRGFTRIEIGKLKNMLNDSQILKCII